MHHIPTPLRSVVGTWRHFLGISEFIILTFWFLIAALPVFLNESISFKNPIGYLWVAHIFFSIMFGILMVIPLDTNGNKVWRVMLSIALYVFDIKKYENKTRNEVNLLMPFDRIEGQFAIGKNSQASIVYVQGNDVSLMDQTAQSRLMSVFKNVMDGTSSTIQLVKTDRLFDYSSLIEEMSESLYQELFVSLLDKKLLTSDEWMLTYSGKPLDEILEAFKNKINPTEFSSLSKKIHAIRSNIESIQQVNSINLFESSYFVVVINNNLEEIKRDVEEIINTFNNGKHLAFTLFGLSIYSYFSSYFKKRNVRFSELKNDKSYSLTDFIPEKIQFKPTYYIETFFDNNNKQVKNYCKTIEIAEFPSMVNDMWLANLIHNTRGNVFIRTRTADSETLQKLIDKKARTSEENLLINTNKLSNELSKNKKHDSLVAITDVIQQGAQIQKITIHVQFIEETKEELNASVNQFITSLRSLMGYKANRMLFRQKEAYSSIMPIIDSPRFDKTFNNIPTYVIAAGYPFNDSKLQDEGAPMLGRAINGTPVMVNFKKRNGRENSNITILGTSGSGKSFGSKKIIKDIVAQGAKAFLIDPEGEYSLLTKGLGGICIDMGSNKKDKMNPFQNYYIGNNAMDRHLLFVKSFIKSAANLSNDETQPLGQYINNFYSKGLKKSITQENFTKITNPKHWPILEEFAVYLDKVVRKEIKGEISPWAKQNKLTLRDKVLYVVNDRVKNSLWNHHSNVSLADVSITTFDIQSLSTTVGDDTIRNTQLLLLINFIEGKMIENKRQYFDPIEKLTSRLNEYHNDEKLKSGKNAKKEKQDLRTQIKLAKQIWKRKWIIVVIDEAHLLISNQNPEAIRFMYGLVKRIRKYNGICITITQNIRDFTDSQYKKETTGILNNAQYMFVFKLKPDDVSQLSLLNKEGGGLTEGEKNRIVDAQVGECLLFLGNNARQQMKITTSQNERLIIDGNI